MSDISVQPVASSVGKEDIYFLGQGEYTQGLASHGQSFSEIFQIYFDGIRTLNEPDPNLIHNIFHG